MARSRTRARTRRRTDALSPWPFVGMAGLVSTLFLYAASGLVAPWWGVLGLLLFWLVLLALALRWWTPHPRRLVWLAGVSAVVWFVVLVAGARFLDWA